MFSFHKPKVYRSSKGCCICKAKSSSSRFTDSKKYEEDFIKCFVLEERRTGEICNACVLLVKRWKKLPVGTDRNWNHVVDARAGPGIKSLTKFKSKNKKKKLKDVHEKLEKIVKKKHVYQKRDLREDSPAMSDDFTEEDCNGTESKNSSRAGSPEGSCDTITEAKLLTLALTYFKQEMICCGMIFKGRNGEVMMDGTLVKPCSGSVSKKQQQQQITILRKIPSPVGSASTSPSHSSASTSPAHSVESTVESAVSKLSKPITNHRFYESSSDSGYDESSNQGVGESKLAKITQNPPSGIKVEPSKSVTLKTIPISEAVRIKNEVPIKLVPIKPISLSTNLTLSNLSLNDGTSISSNPLVDFAIHASSRQPVTN